ncbi:hypothetical protein ACLB2K_072657 [Fragaria x ananassa]
MPILQVGLSIFNGSYAKIFGKISLEVDPAGFTSDFRVKSEVRAAGGAARPRSSSGAVLGSSLELLIPVTFGDNSWGLLKLVRRGSIPPSLLSRIEVWRVK